jgi:hypothetical protein
MLQMSGWIKLHKTLKDWEWYDDHNATRLLVHLLLSVNYEDKTWKGQTIKAGSCVTSWENLAKEIGLSVKQTRTAMAKLEASKEVARYTTNKWQAISLVKWDKLQVECGKEGKQQGTQRATTKEYKEIKNIFTRPSVQEINAYCQEKNLQLNAQTFIDYYDSNGWKVGKNNMKDWKATVRRWAKPKDEIEMVNDPLYEQAKKLGYVKEYT